MALKIESRETNDVTVIVLQGSILLGSGDDELRMAIDKALADGKRKILLNVKKLKDVDSSGVGELIGCYTSVTRRGGKLKLLGLGDRAYDVMSLTRLIHVIESFDDESTAIASFEEPLTDRT